MSALAVAAPLVPLGLSGAVALAGVAGPIWLALASVAVALRGLPVESVERRPVTSEAGEAAP